MSQLRILIVTPEFPPDLGGGIIAYYRDLVTALCSQNCAVTVLKGSAFTHGAESYECEGTPVSVLETERFHRWHSRFEHLAIFPEFQRHLAAAFALYDQAQGGDGFDVVEVTDWGLLFLPWVIGAQARVLVQLHGSCGQVADHEPVSGRELEGMVALLLEKIALEGAPGLSSYSRANVRWWEGVLGRGVDYLPPPLRFVPAEGNDTASDDKWLAVARIQQWKGPQVACAAWELLGDKAPLLEWVGRDTIHGETGQSTAVWLRERFPSVWGGRIQPAGQLSPADVARRMGAAKAVLVPSTWDVFNLAAAEAMASGKPVVVSEGAGVADLVDHGVNGFVFPRNDSAELATLVRHVENLKAEQLSNLGRRAATTVCEQLDPTRIAVEKMKLYRALPESNTNRLPWLRQWLLPNTRANSFGFLDALPLKELSTHVLRRGLKKLLRKRNSR